MYRPPRDAPQFRHGPPGPLPPGTRPRMMNTGRPFSLPVMQGRGPMTPPPFPGGQQHPGLGLPPPSMPPRASQTPSPGRPMPSAPPPGALPLPPDTLPPPPGTLPPAPPLPGMMPSRPRPSGTVPSIAPRGASLGQPLPGPPPGGPSLNLLAPVSCSRPADAVPPQSVLSQASQPHSFESLPPQPPKPNDDEMIRNIEILSQFVIKNGPDFETMARVKQAGDPNFSFLFGGEPGSDAAIGLEYFQWFKMKCQLEEKMSKDGESRARPADPLGAPESSQRFTGPVTASEMASTFTAISDMEMDMDMEDDVALPMPATKDSKNVVEVESEMAGSKLSDQQQKEQTLSSLDLGGIDDREKDLMGVSENVMEASQSKFGEAKEICSDMAFKGPCVEDLSPVRPSPEELLYTLNVEKQVAESLTISKEEPHFVSDAVQERDAMHGSHHEASVTDPPKSSSAVKVPSEIVELAGKELGENSMHNDMEFKEKEAAKPCYDDKSLDEFNNRSALEPDNMKSDTELHGKPDEGSVKVDRFGRLIRKGNSDSESEGAPYTSRAVKMGHSCSRSPSPGYERWRKRSRSRSPWRRSRWSRSRSRSPKRRRSGSRTPFHDFRRGGDARGDRVSRGRGAVPACNNFARGRCFRGASCKFLHQEATCDNVGRWSGAGRSRERIESRQDIKSLGGKENSLFSDVNKPKNSATDRLYNEPDTRNLGERKNQESYRGNDWAIGVCNDFSKGRCFRGAACRYLHQESGDNVGRWSGGGRGRERMESRQDITKSFGAKESSAGLAEKMKTTSPNRTPHEHYRHNLRDQRNQETDRGNDRRVPPCIYFARGFCQKGLSCRFLHQDATGDNGSRWSGAERGRFWKESRQDMPKSFGVAEGSAVAEMGKPMNTSQDRNSDGHGSFNSGKSHSQESERHNNSWVGDKGFIACDAYPVLRPPLSHSAREEFQPLQSQTLPKSLPHEDIGAHPLLQEGLCTPSALGGNLVSHEAGENLRSESLTKGDSQVLVKDLCPTEDLHPKPFQNFSRDFPSLGGQCLSSGQSVGSGSLPMPHNSYQGISLAVSHLNVASNVDPPPPGCPTNSSVMNQPATLSGLGGPTLHQHSPIATKPNSAPPGCPTNSSVMNQPANLSGLGGPTLHQHGPIATNPNITPPGCPTNSSVMNQPANLSGLVGPTLHQHSPIATKPNSAPPGCPTNSSVINQPANLSGLGGPTLHQHSPIATKPNSVSANTSTDIPIAFTEQRSQCAQNFSEPFSLPQLSSGGQKSLMTMLITKPPLSPPHMYKPGPPIISAPLPTFGEQQTYLYSHTGGPPAVGLSAADQPCNDIPVQRDKFEPLYGSIEPVSFGASENSKKNMLDSNKEKDMDIKEVIKESCMAPLLENVSPHDKVANAKTASLSGPEDVVGNNKHKDGDASSFQRIELCDAAQANINAGVGVVESESPGREGKNSSPVPPLEAAAGGGGGVGDIDMDQAHTQDESKKSKEIRTMKLFRSVLAEFVKEVLKPTWREGHMSKEAFKTIVKKVVDKVAGTLQSHQIPKTQERIDQYVASSRLKLTKLVQGYVDKYVKS